MLLHKNQTATLLFFCIVRIFLNNNIHMDILPESLIFSNLCKIGMVVFFCHHHLKFYTLASLGQVDILQFFLCFRIIYIGFSKEILEFNVENRFTGLAIVFGNRLLELLLENAAGLTYDHLPAGYNLLQIFWRGFHRRRSLRSRHSRVHAAWNRS